ncbi:MAG: hydrogen gas-evolving membrane-bound hydrogenase subunit E [Bacillota bacterium]
MGFALGAILLPFLGAFLMPLLYRPLGRRLGIAALAFAVTALVLVVLTPEVSQTIPWVPQLGIDLTIHADGWGKLLAILISGIGSLVFLYSILYLGPEEDLGKFYLYILLFMGAMLGVVFSGNLMLLYIFWELTSISSFLLIGFWYTRESGQYGALKSMILTVGGGLAMLAGIVILGNIGGSYEFTSLLAKRAEIISDPLGSWALLLILIGAFSKSAQIPFHIWLPDAMSAPTPVSAYLHSATMVKAGLFLVARFWPLFSGHDYWLPVVGTVGMVTMALGSFLALQKTDLKAILALSTVSQLGLIMWLFGLGTIDAAQAGVFHLLNHSTFKGLLFMVVGIIDHETGTRDITRLSGLRKAMPISFVLAAIGAASMAGIPPLNGFLSKEMFLESVFHSPMGFMGAFMATAASVLTTTYSLILAHKIWFGKESHDTPKHPHEAPFLMLLPPAILAALVVGIGLMPGLVEHTIVEPAALAVIGEKEYPFVHIALWHGVQPALFMSVIAIGGGILAYLGLDKVVATFRRWAPERYNANNLYDYLWWRNTAVEKGAKWLTNIQMTGFLRDYLVFTLGVTVVAFLGTMAVKGVQIPKLQLAPVSLPELLLMVIIAIGTIFTLFSNTRLAAMAAISLVGMPTSLYFALMRAPDLALTQLVIEVITAVLFLLVFAHLPQLKVYPRTPRLQDINVLIAVGVGVLATAVTLLANGARLFPPTVAEWYLKHSHDLAGGNNVVNVTLVDFRGFDTMGEITVLTVAGLAVFMLIKVRQPKQKGGKG